MLLRSLKIAGLLSFGPQGIDLPLHRLNVLVGPIGSGKSNLLAILALLRATPSDMAAYVNESGGIREWRWKGVDAQAEARVEADVEWIPPRPDLGERIRHRMLIGMSSGTYGDRLHIADESIDVGYVNPAFPRQRVFGIRNGSLILGDPDQPESRIIPRRDLDSGQSILSQVKDPTQYPAIAGLQRHYASLELFRDWEFGPRATIRNEQSTLGRDDYLAAGGDNLAVVLSNFDSRTKQEFVRALGILYDGIVDFRVSIRGGRALLFVIEQGGREIPATRLSDGTLRYLCLLAILLHPTPPRLVAIEEPELGLHPDVLPEIARLLVQASESTQLVVTTHSRILVDALGEDPSRVVICERVDGASQLRRLDADALKEWMDRYTLGQLWSMGELGGNRW